MKFKDYIHNHKILSTLWRRFTEQNPGPLTEANPKGWLVPDPIQSRLRGIDKIEWAYRTLLPMYNAIDIIYNNIFGYPKWDLKLETSSEQAREILNSHFIRSYEDKSVKLDPHNSIHDFMAGSASTLLLLGRKYCKMIWSDDGKSLTRILQLPVETMKPQYRKGEIWRYRQQYSIFTSNELIQKTERNVHWELEDNIRGTTFFFAPDEIFFLEWPFSQGRKRGVAPAREASKYARIWQRYWERSLLYSEAMAHPEIEDWRHLKIRNYSFDKELQYHKRIEALIRKPFHVIQDIPQTQYYDIWQSKKMLQFLGDTRQFLLDEFNNQVVNAILKRNQLDTQAKYVCDYKLTNEEIESLFKQYTMGEISYKEVALAMYKDKEQNTIES